MTLLHIFAGAVAILAGGGALIFRKGFPRHRLAGKIFATAMIASALAGSAIALQVENQFIAFLAGLLTTYLVISSTVAVRGRATGAWRAAMLAGSVSLTLWFFWLAWQAGQSPAGALLGYGSGPYIFLGTVAGLAAVGDGHALLRYSLDRVSQLSRHLWRMCFAFFIAAGSLFTGPGAKAFPEAVRDSGVLSAPEPLILLVMLFWLVRVRMKSSAVRAVRSTQTSLSHPAP